MVEYPNQLEVVVEGRIGAKSRSEAESEFREVVQGILTQDEYRIGSIDVRCRSEIPGLYKCKADITFWHW